MRVVLVLAVALMVSGCGMLGRFKQKDALPEPWHPHEHSKIDDTHRDGMHSNDPGRDQY